MQDEAIHQVLALVAEDCRQWQIPSVSVIAEEFRSAFHVLVSCIISLRTKDSVTASASARLFQRAATVEDMAALNVGEIADLIYPAGFYRNKAAQLQAICNRLITEFGGQVPDDLDTLLAFKGVGRKTANLVLTLGHGKPGICVDIHVHRITNRWGYVTCSTPDQTELELRAKLPNQYWMTINDLLVSYGQHRCFPVNPACSCCRLTAWCGKVGVVRHR
ncbi:MAG: endonuclease III [Geobacter sp.]|nr:endonuclease III [Geobacter sp.]